MVQAMSAKVQHFERERVMEDDDLAGLMHKSTPGSIQPMSVQQDLQEEQAHPERSAMALGQEVQEPARVEEYRQRLQLLERDSRLEVKRLNELLLRRSSELADERTHHAQQRAEAATLRSKLSAVTNSLSSVESSTVRLWRALGRAGLGHALIPTPQQKQQQQQRPQQLPEGQRQQPQLCLKLDEPIENDSAALITPRMASVGRIGVPKLNLPQDQAGKQMLHDDEPVVDLKAGKNTLHDDALVADLKDLTRWAHNCHRARKTP